MPSTNAAAKAPSISANTNTAALATPGATSGRVTCSMVCSLPAPSTRELSSSAGSIDFIAAEIITKATVPSNSAITQAIPSGV